MGRKFLALTGFVILALVALSVLLGKDLHWDLYNYHLYAPYAALHIPLAEDFMGAGWLRYINPYAAMPFYWMVMADWPAVLVSAVLASIHAINVSLVWWIARAYLFQGKTADDLSAIATALAVASTVFIGLVGSSFTDPLTSLLLLGALAALMHSAARNGDRFWLLLAGLVAGLACGLKLTNSVLAAALWVASFSIGDNAVERIKRAASFALASAIGGCISGGWWAYKLYQEFGNPVFPLQNALFKSPDFPTVSLHNERFVGSAWDHLTLPFRMVQQSTWMYYEVAAPDLRFALIFICLLVLLGAVALRRTAWGARVISSCSTTPIRVFWIFFSLAFVLWILTSSNARYGLVLILLAGPAAVWAVHAVVPRTKIAKGILLTVLAAQVIGILHVGNPRWGANDWTRHWFEYRIPTELRDSPFGYITLGTNSNSSLLPFLHPQSRAINITGLYVIDPNGAGAARVKAFIQNHAGRLRMLAPLHKLAKGSRFHVPKAVVQGHNQQLQPWGLEIQVAGCIPIWEASSTLSIEMGVAGGLLSCPLMRIQGDLTTVSEERARIDAALNALEERCPMLLRPKGVYSVQQGRMWTRRYFDTDTLLFALKGNIYYSRQDFGPFDVELGTIDDAIRGLTPRECAMASTK